VRLLSSARSADNRDMVSNPAVTLQRTLVLVVALLLYAPTAETAAAQAADFGFRFEFGSCLVERLDTFDGTFTQGYPGPSARIATAQMALTDAQMSAIYRAIESVRFFDYPAVFVGVPPGAVETIHISPSYKYGFEVRNAGVVHTVSWDASNKPTTIQADRLRDFFTMVQGLIYEHPEFKRLPPVKIGCM
jgi:hypothetical protein